MRLSEKILLLGWLFFLPTLTLAKGKVNPDPPAEDLEVLPGDSPRRAADPDTDSLIVNPAFEVDSVGINWERPKREFNVGAAFDLNSFSQTGLNDTQLEHVSANLGFRFPLISHLEFRANGGINAITLSNNRSSYAVRFLDTSASIGYLIFEADESYPNYVIIPFLKFYYGTMLVTNSGFGYQNATAEGPGVELEWGLARRNVFSAKTSFLLHNDNFGISNHYFDVGLAWKHRFEREQAIKLSATFIDQRDHLNQGSYSRTSLSLAADYLLTF